MPQLTPEGTRILNNIAQQHQFSSQAVTHMLFAVKNGNGNMAQFNHPEFGGSGQWMQGGMIMLGDMFNNYLKNRVDNLCLTLSNILKNQTDVLQTGSFQTQSQTNNAGYQSATTGDVSTATSLSPMFMPDPQQEWWPAELGQPNATGSQNSMRYAYFANAHRLAVDVNNNVWVYDTQDHQIGGFSQQQGSGGNILFTSQYGNVDLTRLPVVLRNGQAVLPPIQTPTAAVTRESIALETDIFTAIERLGSLAAKEILTEDEFMTKKAELLARL